MNISQSAKEAAERILRHAGDPLCERGAAEIVQAAIEAETAKLLQRADEVAHGGKRKQWHSIQWKLGFNQCRNIIARALPH